MSVIIRLTKHVFRGNFMMDTTTEYAARRLSSLYCLVYSNVIQEGRIRMKQRIVNASREIVYL